ncbi:zeta toxin family protein [Streptomyces sp. NPDC090106]|uniref:zeta toxin family protein n=1 Tax=Streptomyces sp. NPDC090106 TaxID=3365946 RepID=UPI0037F90158
MDNQQQWYGRSAEHAQSAPEQHAHLSSAAAHAARQQQQALENERRTYGGLTYREVEKIYERRISSIISGRSRENPIAVIMVGQPGSGKSSAELGVKARLDCRDAVTLDGENLLAYHPYYEAHAFGNDGGKAQGACEAAVGVWRQRALDQAVAQRCHLVLPMFMDAGDPNGARWNMEFIDHLRKQRYRVAMVFMAVDDTRSNQGAVIRYLAGRETTGHGRWPSLDDKYYAGVLSLADAVDRSDAVDYVYVARRGGELIYSRERGQPARAGGVRQAIVEERGRPWTETETRGLLEAQDYIRDAAKSYDGKVTELPGVIRELDTRIGRRLDTADREPVSSAAARPVPTSQAPAHHAPAYATAPPQHVPSEYAPPVLLAHATVLMEQPPVRPVHAPVPMEQPPVRPVPAFVPTHENPVPRYPASVPTYPAPVPTYPAPAPTYAVPAQYQHVPSQYAPLPQTMPVRLAPGYHGPVIPVAPAASMMSHMPTYTRHPSDWGEEPRLRDSRLNGLHPGLPGARASRP